jgi:hypothetical protein
LNNPPYYIVDVFSEIVGAVKTGLNLSVLNYQYGYVEELNETLQQWSRTPSFAFQKYPLVWLAQPFTITRGTLGLYGKISDLRLFIITDSQKTLKASERMDQNFKPVIYPIYEELLNQIKLHPAVTLPNDYYGELPHNFTDRYYWGEAQEQVLNDVVDCSEISQLKIEIQNKQDCIPFKSF